MKVRIVERYDSDSGAVKEYVLKKVDGLSRYFDQIISVDAIHLLKHVLLDGTRIRIITFYYTYLHQFPL